MKAAEARAETERILAQQAAELERKKADMDKREAEREAARVAQVPLSPMLQKAFPYKHGHLLN